MSPYILPSIKRSANRTPIGVTQIATRSWMGPSAPSVTCTRFQTAQFRCEAHH